MKKNKSLLKVINQFKKNSLKLKIGLLLGLLLAIFFLFSPTSMHTIVLTEDGFVPQKISIKVGDTVIFKNHTNKPFWPASDFHPDHTIYPDLMLVSLLNQGENGNLLLKKRETGDFMTAYFPYLRGLFRG